MRIFKSIKFNKIKIKRIKTRILIYMLLISIIPVSILGLLSYSISNYVNLNQIKNIHKFNLDTYNTNLDIIFSDLTDTMRSVISDEKVSMSDNTIMDILKQDEKDYRNSSIYSRYLIKQTIDKKVKNIINNKLYIVSIFLSNNKGFKYSNNISPIIIRETSFYDINEKEIWNEKWYKKLTHSGGQEAFFGYDVFSDYANTKKNINIFSCAKMLYNLKNFSEVGYMVFNVDRDILNKVFPKGKELINSSYVIVDAHTDGEPIIVFESGSINGTANIVKDYYAGKVKTEERWIINSVKNNVSGWDILYVIDKKKISLSSNLIGMMTILVSIFIILCVIILNIMLSKIINKPLHNLENAIMSVASGKTLEIKETFQDDEIGSIGKEFKKMVEQNLQLKDKLYQSTIKQKEAEFKALQAQIKPHFLYNTLDSLYFMASMKKEDDIAKMAISLSEIFKLSLNKGKEFTTVHDEIRHIENYLFILRTRYGDKINTEIDIQENLLECKILKLTLQPIVENSIYHGLEPKVGKGDLSIKGTRIGNDMVFVIEDDGVGMDINKVELNGYGLQNVRERIKLYYGENYGVIIESNLNIGTKVTIKLPCLDKTILGDD